MRACRVAAFAPALALVACGPSLPQPATAPQPRSAFVPVPYPPPAARVETVPPRPSPVAVWIDGQWAWDGARWQWTTGAWVAPPPGGRFAPWALELLRDGRLMFAPASWRDRQGNELTPARVLAAAVGAERNATMPARCR
jgi:hypothetical protein